MLTKRSLEGYMLMDNSQSPGVPDSVMVRDGLPRGSGFIKFESATITCSHCETVVILNPDRSRPKGYCKGCDHYLCDNCEAKRFLGEPCYPWKARIEDLREEVAKGVPYESAYEQIFVKSERPGGLVLLDMPSPKPDAGIIIP